NAKCLAGGRWIGARLQAWPGFRRAPGGADLRRRESGTSLLARQQGHTKSANGPLTRPGHETFSSKLRHYLCRGLSKAFPRSFLGVESSQEEACKEHKKAPDVVCWPC